ncbi:MAG: FAD-dependent oxidoreductase [Pirellulales bacterium]|nr:FAD-dependent oxidoreductase [Pirellulales bacterium]
MMETSLPSIAVLGAGPIGIEAALYGRFLGHDVKLYEQARVGHHVEQWGHVKLFTPFAMNRSPLAVAALRAQDAAWQAPEDAALLTGQEYLQRLLLPLVKTDLLTGVVHEQTRVLSIGRANLSKSDHGCGIDRKDAAFRLLLCDSTGKESVATADVIIDATGVYSQHCYLGRGGVPARGERQLAGDIDYQLPSIGKDRSCRFAGRHALVVGGGCSAATSVVALAALAESVPETRISWVVRRPRGKEGAPLFEIPGDPLQDRVHLTDRANRLAMGSDAVVTYLPHRTVETVRRLRGSGAFEVELLNMQEASDELNHEVTCDSILAHVGFRPDCSLFSELQVQLCHVSEAPMKLAMHLVEQNATDCLGQEVPAGNLLVTSEPNYFLIGNKSYGRDSRFLISMGLEQVRQVFASIRGDANLDLYRTMRE